MKYSWPRAFVLVLLLNVIFLILLLSYGFIPSEVFADRIQQAFSTGELVENDYLPYDVRRGVHQYNDCNILQMMTNKDSSLVTHALGPWLHMADSSATEACRTLRELVVDGRNPEEFVSSRYTRYWHGYLPVLSVLLMCVEISTLRVILRIAVYAGLVLLILSSFRERRFLLFTGPVSISGALFWGLPYFGPGMSHAPGDFTVLVGLACLVFWHRNLACAKILIPSCAGFGATVVYFEMLTGPLPVAGGLLFPCVYLLSRLTTPAGTGTDHHLRLAASASIAFAMGALITVGARVLVAVVLVQPSGLDTFVGNLSLYTQPVDSTASVPGFLRPLGRLFRRGTVLTFGSQWGLAILYTSVVFSWLLGSWLAYRRAARSSRIDLFAFVVGAAIVPLWTVLLPTHTFMHAGFMARILIVPISLGWAAIVWQLWIIGTQTPYTIPLLAQLLGPRARSVDR